MRPLDLLANFTLDVWLAARYAPALGGMALDGRTWERMVAGLLYRPGFTQRQGPGTATLFGRTAASGVQHEIDGAASSRCGAFIVECKSTAGGITKADTALFHAKVMDFYQKNVATASGERWWRFLCSTKPTVWPARATALSLGLLICDPDRLPLPVLVRAASRPTADMHLPEPLLQEIIRLGERALVTQQDRWPYNPRTDEIAFKPRQWSQSDVADLLWLEDELSAHLLGLFETRCPSMLESRAMKLLWYARKTA